MRSANTLQSKADTPQKVGPIRYLLKFWSIFWSIALAYMFGNFVYAFASLQDPQEAAVAVYEPTFTLIDDTIWAGKAFIAASNHCPLPLLISASHLFGPSGGYAKQLDPQGIKEKTLAFKLTSLTGLDPINHPAGSLTPPEGAGDMVAFEAPESLADTALPLAESLPSKGSRVWVVTEIYNGNPSLVHEAQVWGSEDGNLYYALVDSDYSYQATSGAPVVNSVGEVVAINLGGGEDNNGAPYGFGNPVTKWTPLLEQHCRTVYAD